MGIPSTYNLSSSQRHEILERDGFKCRECGSTENLEVHGKNNVLSKIVLSNDPRLIDLMPKLNSEVLPSSSTINGYSAINGYVLFRVPYQPIEKAELDSYLLSVIDIHDNETVIEPIFINEWREK
jgi:hypothetical protein